MARVVYGPYITEINGSIGGLTFHKNNSGNIAKMKPNQPLIASPSQAAQQLNISTLVSIWASLSFLDKYDWKDLADTHTHLNPWGENKTLNGFQWFMSCNLNLIAIGNPIIRDRPDYVSIAPPAAFGLTASFDSLKIFIDPGWNPGIDTIIIYASPPIRQSTLKLRRSMFIIDEYTGPNVTHLDITAAWSTFFNIDWETFFPTSNSNIIVRARQVQHLTGFSSSLSSELIYIPDWW